MNLTTLLRRLRRASSGVAMTEFALGAPILLTAGLWGAEMANYALINMKVSQLAEHIADNGSRIGDSGTLQNRKIYESDINDIMYGAQMQAGGGMDLFDAICQSMTTVATAGFGNYDANLGHWDSALIEMIATVFMFLGGLNFGLHWYAWRRATISHYQADAELRTFYRVNPLSW